MDSKERFNITYDKLVAAADIYFNEKSASTDRTEQFMWEWIPISSAISWSIVLIWILLKKSELFSLAGVAARLQRFAAL